MHAVTRRGRAPIESVRGALTRSGVAAVPSRVDPTSESSSRDTRPEVTGRADCQRERRGEREGERERETERREKERKKERERLNAATEGRGAQIDFSPSTSTSDRVERSEKRSADGKSNEELMTVSYED